MNKINLASVLFLIFITGCTLKNSHAPQDGQKSAIYAFEVNDNCPNVCWLGIQPGVTSRDDAIAILEASDRIDHNTLDDHFEIGLPVKWLMDVGGDTYSWVYFGIENGLVQKISFGDLYAIKVSDLIDLLGVPDEISVRLESGLEYSYTRYVIYYHSLRILIGANPIGMVAGPSPDDPTRIMIINTEFDDANMGPQLIEDYRHRQPWLGYGHLDEYLPDHP